MSPIGGYIEIFGPSRWNHLGRIGGVALWEEVFHWGMVLGFQKTHRIPSDSLVFMFMDQDVISQLLVQHHAYQSVVKLHAMMVKNSTP